jgi:ADP-heptose:LPS heptosyltransferase
VFIGLEGGLMHLARAVGCRSAVIFGGRVHPSQIGYSSNESLYWDGACAPCWQRDNCDYDRICLGDISADMVIAAARRQAGLYGTPLAIDRLTI